MKYRHNTRQNRTIVNVTDDTSDAIIRARTLAQPVCTAPHNTSFGLARSAVCAFVLLMLICGTTPVVAGYPVPVDTVNGISGFLNTTIPSNSTIDTYTTAGIDTVESTLDCGAITSGIWNSYLASAQYCYDNERRAGMRMNLGGDYTSSRRRLYIFHLPRQCENEHNILPSGPEKRSVQCHYPVHCTKPRKPIRHRESRIRKRDRQAHHGTDRQRVQGFYRLRD